MRKLKIGRLYIKPLYVALLTLSLLLVVGGTIALLNHPAILYDYGYSFKENDLKGLEYKGRGGVGWNSIGFDNVLAKGEVVRGKLMVESGMVVLLITDKKERRVVDSGEIQAGKSFSFSVMSDWTYTSYEVSFFLTDDTNARFYCNLAPIISGTRFEETGEFIPEWLFGQKTERLVPEMRGITVNFKPAKLR